MTIANTVSPYISQPSPMVALNNAEHNFNIALRLLEEGRFGPLKRATRHLRDRVRQQIRNLPLNQVDALEPLKPSDR
ncbi:MAG: hypothetical protein ACSNEK_09585 [Parachlamydiaceae bacterium]